MRRSVTLTLLVLCLGVALAPAARAAVTTVREPAFGIPHIHADTDAELYYEYGRQDAKDRLGQFVILSRAARGTLAGLFGAGSVNSDVNTRSPGYSSKELNDMVAKMPADAQAAIDNYVAGVNAEIGAVLSGPLAAMPAEVATAVLTGQALNLFGNAVNVSDQVDPGYSPATQFTRELSVSNAILQVRNFGSSSGFGNEFSNLTALTALQAKFGAGTGAAVWNDLFFTNDPLSPVSVPDPTTPGFGGPVAQAPVSRATMFATVTKPLARILAAVKPATRESRDLGNMLAALFTPTEKVSTVMVASSDHQLSGGSGLPKYDYKTAMEDLERNRALREAHLRRLGAYPYIGSYMWLLDGSRSHGGDPWLGGFPQTGIQTPSIMHAIEADSAEGSDHRVNAVGMTFLGAPSVLIGHTQNVAFTTTTAGLKNTYLIAEHVINENTDNARYNDEGTPTVMAKRNEVIQVLGGASQTHTFFRTHVRGTNGGSRPVSSFIADRVATAAAGSNATTIMTTGLSGSYVGGFVMLTSRAGAGQIRPITANTATSITVSPAFTTAPVAGQTGFAAAKAGNEIIAVAIEFSFWREESDTAYGFSLYQRAENVLDIRRGVRWIPSTHNFNAADNQGFNGVGVDNPGKGNIGYWSSGISPVRQSGDPRLPIDGSGPNPLVVFGGTVSSSGADTLTDGTAPFNIDLSPEPLNFAYDNPGQTGSEYVVVISGGTGHRQTRRVASNTASTLTLEEDWGVLPAAGDTYEVMEVIATPEAINPSQGYTANWNGKASRATTPPTGREFRHTFILERLMAMTSAKRADNRVLNADLAGIDGDGKRGRFLLPRLRQAYNGVGDLGDSRIGPVLAQLETAGAQPIDGRRFTDAVNSTMATRENDLLQSWFDLVATAVFGDELAGTGVSLPGGAAGRREAVTHAVDTNAADVAGSLTLSQDYFNGSDWRVVFITQFTAALNASGGGIPAPVARGVSNYVHPFGYAYPTTPVGNRGTYEQIVQVKPDKPKCGGPRGEMMFPLGQSGYVPTNGAPFGFNFAARDPNTDSMHPVWRDWRFIPMLKAGASLAVGNGDADGNGILDAWECWYFDKTGVAATSQQNGPGDGDGDRLSNLEEYLAGSDPNDSDTDDDGVLDGFDAKPQDRLITTARVPTVEPTSDKGRGDGSGTGKGQ